MRRILQVFVLSMVVGASVAGVASAAGSPAVTTGAATKVGNSTAVLNATVNPNGHATQYDFTLGPTTAYGVTTTLRTVKAGTKAVAVKVTVTGLTPGTTYHYRINAISTGGAVVGADRAFTTTGHPPAAVVTGGAVNVGKTVATPTGVINPEGATTTWVVQYGLTPWHIAGNASLSLLFFDVTVHFDKTWGSTAAAFSHRTAVGAHGGARRQVELERRPPQTVRAAITPVGSPADAGEAVLFDPASTLRITQRVVPLDQPITRFAGTPLGQTTTSRLKRRPSRLAR